MTAPRLYFAQARDGLFFRRFGDIHPAFKTPHISILGQGMWASVLALTGSYTQLVSYAVFTFWIFYGLTVAGLLVIRHRHPDAPRPYRMFGYPVTPLLFAAVSVAVVLSAVLSSPATSAIGFAILAAGVPAYYLWRRSSTSQGAGEFLNKTLVFTSCRIWWKIQQVQPNASRNTSRLFGTAESGGAFPSISSDTQPRNPPSFRIFAIRL